MEFKVTSDLMALIIGAVISVLFSYVPGLNAAYAALKEEYKKLIMLGLLIIVSGVIYVGSCKGWFVTDIVCGKEGIWSLLTILIYSVVGNQGAFKLSPTAKSVRIARDAAEIRDYGYTH